MSPSSSFGRVATTRNRLWKAALSSCSTRLDRKERRGSRADLDFHSSTRVSLLIEQKSLQVNNSEKKTRLPSSYSIYVLNQSLLKASIAVLVLNSKIDIYKTFYLIILLIILDMKGGPSKNLLEKC